MDITDILSLFVRWIHVIAAVVWVGGNLILAMVIVPHFRQSLPPIQRIKLLMEIGKRFEPVVWGCIGVLFFTGIVNIFFSIDITSPTPIANAFMRTLLIKILLFFILTLLTVLHSMIFAPRLAAAIEDLDSTLEDLPPEIKPLRSRMSIVSSLMGVVSLLILLAAVALRMGI